MRLRFLFLLLLILPLISSAEINSNSEFSQGETLIASISGDFLENLQKENIFFYREPNVRISLDYDLARINDIYYVYAQLGSLESNLYSMRIEGVRYVENSQLIKEDLVKIFTIKSEIADFRINPGFVITDENFEIKIQNLQNTEISVEIWENKTSSKTGLFSYLLGLFNSKKIIELKPGEIKTIQFNLGEETSFSFLEFSTNILSYSIPVYYFVYETTDSTTQDTTEDTTSDSTTQDTTEDTTSDSTTQDTTEDTTSDSTTQENQTNYYNDSTNTTADSTTNATETTSEENQTINYNETLPEENVTFYYEEPFFEEEEIWEKETIKSASTKTCSEMNGEICNENENCEGTKEYAADAVCCIGKCIEIEKDERGIMIGWILLAQLFCFLLYGFLEKNIKAQKKEKSIF